METEELIKADDFCTHYHVEDSLLESMQETGLIEVVWIQQTRYLHSSQLCLLEKMVRLHQELGINLAGIEAITHLLERHEAMQAEIKLLRNRLRHYERDL
ncbi:chaperone modulator CbpM [Telluribacter sp. SYSU D00476]|uniref:chaperone modulator CbpM n=1 Tax=Telluribacter sp. SYSU D00476 TaxID=2811430 RepID=UPI001FF2B05C|nr:chaperone modulator CbpM [Telluribacter sp. SYSU D00476]